MKLDEIGKVNMVVPVLQMELESFRLTSDEISLLRGRLTEILDAMEARAVAEVRR
jgi:hypothetical protein